MTSVRGWSLAFVSGMALSLAGCGSSNESKPNPDLKVPEVPPGGHGSKDKGMENPNAKKK